MMNAPGINTIAIHRLTTRLMVIRHGERIMASRDDDFKEKWAAAHAFVTAKVRRDTVLIAGNFEESYDPHVASLQFWARLCDVWLTTPVWLEMIRRGLIAKTPEFIRHNDARRREWVRSRYVRPWIMISSRRRRYFP